jgi:hypothetical protein
VAGVKRHRTQEVNEEGDQMKPFVVKPFVVKPFVVKPLGTPGPHWLSYLLAGLVFLLSVSALIGALIIRTTDTGIFLTCIYTSQLANFLGLAFCALGRVQRETGKNQADLTKRLTEQDERIRQFEARIAALLPPSPPA